MVSAFHVSHKATDPSPSGRIEGGVSRLLTRGPFDHAAPPPHTRPRAGLKGSNFAVCTRNGGSKEPCSNYRQGPLPIPPPPTRPRTPPAPGQRTSSENRGAGSEEDERPSRRPSSFLSFPSVVRPPSSAIRPLPSVVDHPVTLPPCHLSLRRQSSAPPRLCASARDIVRTFPIPSPARCA